ncbi:hypothetical protein GGR53DRAFT_488357 [Hypoxylon sp. FL1150]|nr:hypothetical protein GGR53DRAFT_488357 [Hypoxylon sp. FL1150]
MIAPGNFFLLVLSYLSFFRSLLVAGLLLSSLREVRIKYTVPSRLLPLSFSFSFLFFHPMPALQTMRERQGEPVCTGSTNLS